MIKFILLLISFSSAFAHEGPPYPILIDQKVFENRLSIWADPDVGEGTFQFFLEDGNLKELAFTAIEIRAVSPKGIEDKQTYQAKHSSDDKLVAILPFSSEGLWTLSVILKRPDGNWEQVIVKVEVTPPGPSKLEFAIYTLPFLVAAFFWIKIFWYKHFRKKNI
jgi:hypothetical protein